MGWFFGQIWILCVIAFVAGAVIAWLLAVIIYPSEREAFADIEGDAS